MIRLAKIEDAPRIIEVMETVYGETDFLNYSKGEFKITIEGEEKWIQKQIDDPYSRFYVIEDDGEIVGTCGLTPESKRPCFMHQADIGIAIIKKAWHKGLAREAFTKAIEEAKQIGYEMILLKVYATNTRAISLYESFGFIQYGKLERAKKMKDGSYMDDLLMVKYL